MARKKHLAMLKKGVDHWNDWRGDNPDELPDLSGADLSNANLPHVNLDRANLKGARLQGANLTDAEITFADLTEADLEKAQLFKTQVWRSNLTKANLTGALIERADLSYGNFKKANLNGATAWSSIFDQADFTLAQLLQTNFQGSSFYQAKLCEVEAWRADFLAADLTEANLSGSILDSAVFTNANLTGAILCDTSLENAIFVNTIVEGADISFSSIYGAAVWGLTGSPKTSRDLVITRRDEPKITVDDLEVAQFIYLLLSNQKIRSVIQSVTSKAVLILGRFTKRRKPVLDALHTALRDLGLVPILFDFKPSKNRDLTETVQLLANMCRFVIADVTDAKSLPQELSAIVPNLPSVPVQPIILKSQNEYAMFEHWRRYPSVLPLYAYQGKSHLLKTLGDGILAPIEAWEKAADKDKLGGQVMRRKLREQESEISELKARLETAGL